MDQLLQDIAYALRVMRTRVGLTAAAVLTLAVGIGATAAVFTVVRGVLLRPLPYDAPERIVQLWNPYSNEPGNQRGRSALAAGDIADIRRDVTAFQLVASYAPPTAVNLTGGDSPERIVLTRSTPELFQVLNAIPLVGRTFTKADEQAGAVDVIVLSYEFWQQQFAGDRAVIGRTLQVDGAAHRVIGVLAPSFVMPADYHAADATAAWTPLALDAHAANDRSDQWLHAIARVRAGATAESANQQLAALTQRWIAMGDKIADLPPYYAVPIEEELFASVRRPLLLVFAAVVFVLLIACVNVANLLLARADERRAEMALRAALGAGRGRILRQLLTEATLLGAAGTLLGVVLGQAAVRALIALQPAHLPRLANISMDGTVLAFTALLGCGTALLCGVAPALYGAAPDLHRDMRSSSRTTSGGVGGHRLRTVLASGEVALAIVLLIGAGLMIRTFGELSRIDLGFDAKRALTFSIALPAASADADARVRFHGELARRLGELSGVQAAGATRALPLVARLGGGSIEVDGAPLPRPGEGSPNARWQIVTPGYFDAMRLRRVEGRFFEPSDRADGTPAVVINETLARQLWPGHSALGHRLRNRNADVPWFTVVGVIEDVRHAGVTDAPSPTIYFPLEQIALTRSFTPNVMSFVARTSGEPLALVPAVRELVRSMDGTLPIADLQPLDTIVSRALAQVRFTMLLLAMFAAVAVGLAAVGIYALLSQIVSRQRREIGIRLALGAPASQVRRLIVWRGMRLTLFGLASGVGGALLLTRVMEGLLYGVQPFDVRTFVLVPFLFAAVALAATYVPAHRASAVDPLSTLNQE